MLEEQEDTPVPSRAVGRRGQAALRRLTTTDGFTNAKLTLADRKLILFLLVVLVDGHDSLTSTYTAVATAYGHVPGHWAHGSDVADLQKKCSKFLGRGARRRPRWEEIRDVLAVAVSDRNRSLITAYAAGLYCQAATLRSPGSGYAGLVRIPTWIAEPSVAAWRIRAELDEVTRTERAADVPAQRESDAAAALRLEEKEAELNRREHQLRREIGEERRRADALIDVAVGYLRMLRPGVADGDLRREFVADLNAAIDRLARS